MPKDGNQKPRKRKPVNYSQWRKFDGRTEAVYEAARKVLDHLRNDTANADDGRIVYRAEEEFRPLNLFVSADQDPSLRDRATALTRALMALEIARIQGLFMLAHELLEAKIVEMPPGLEYDDALYPLRDEGRLATCIKQFMMLRKRPPTANERDPARLRNAPLAVVQTPEGDKLAVSANHLAGLVEAPDSETNRYFRRSFRDSFLGPMVHLGVIEAHELPGHAPRYAPHITLDAFAEEIWEPIATEIWRWYGPFLD